MLFITCLYDESTSHNLLSKYEGFRLTEPGQEDQLFYSGDPVKDYRETILYVDKRIAITKLSCSLSSSVDHFVRDNRGSIIWYIDKSGWELMKYSD